MDTTTPTSPSTPLAQPLPTTNDDYPTKPIDNFKKKSFFSIKNIISLLLLLILVAIAGYFIFNRVSYIQMASKNIVLPTDSPPSPTVDPTTNWQTYDNGLFSFKYPDSWYLNDQSKTLYLFPAGKSLEEIYHDKVGYFFTLDEIPNPKDLTVQEYWEEYVRINGRRNPGFEKTIIKNLEAIKTQNNSLDSYDTTYFIKGNKVIYRISLVRSYMKDDIAKQGDASQQFEFVKSKFPEADPLFDEILKSFKVNSQ